MPMNRTVNCPLCGNPQEIYSTEVGFMAGASANEGKRYVCTKCGSAFHIQATKRSQEWSRRGG